MAFVVEKLLYLLLHSIMSRPLFRFIFFLYDYVRAYVCVCALLVRHFGELSLSLSSAYFVRSWKMETEVTPELDRWVNLCRLYVIDYGLEKYREASKLSALYMRSN